MAVKPEVIKARLKVLFPKANLSQKRIDAYASKLAPKPADDADETAIDAIINDFNEVIDFVSVAQEDDRVRTLEANQKKPVDPPTPTPVPTPSPTDPPAPNDVNAKLLEAITKLTGEVEAIKSGKITDTKKLTAQQAFEKSEVLKLMKPEIKEKWLQRINVTPETTEDEITAQVASLETEYSDLTQSIADSSSYSGPVPSGGTPKGSDDKVIDAVITGFRI